MGTEGGAIVVYVNTLGAGKTLMSTYRGNYKGWPIKTERVAVTSGILVVNASTE